MDGRKLLLEVWEDFSDSGAYSPMLCCAGRRGEAARGLLGPKARLLATIEAGSHFEAMTIYNRYLGREPYRTDQPSDYDAYPDNWLEKQQL